MAALRQDNEQLRMMEMQGIHTANLGAQQDL